MQALPKLNYTFLYPMFYYFDLTSTNGTHNFTTKIELIKAFREQI